ncbi:MAG TPA: ATP-binding protein [Candidatus Saccharimonadaceae bacterium]|nr:ATP-binding protein [Candidatus Saccharimonadaceae bacterium]
MNGIASVVLIVTAVVNFGFAALLLASIRRRAEHYWFCAMLLSLAFWVLGIAEFLSFTTDTTAANLWVREYYVAASTIALTLLEFSLWFPRRIILRRSVQACVWIGYVAMLAGSIFRGGFINQISVAGYHSVSLNVAQYSIFAVVFSVFCIAAIINLFRGEAYARKKGRRHLMRQMQIVIAGALIALAGGGWFNLVLPVFDPYQYVWIGPLCTLAFTAAVVFAVAKQGLFDVRQSLVRSSGFALIVAILVLLYAGVTYVLTQLFFTSYFQSFWGTAAVQMALVLIVALTIVPLRQSYTRIASRVLYGKTYDNEYVVDALRAISQHEIQTKALTIKSLRALAIALEPQYATAYILNADGDITVFNGGEANPTERQDAILREVVRLHASGLPTTGRMYDIDHLRRAPVYQLLGRARVGAFIRLDAQGEAFGVVFVGHKKRERLYHDKDLRLFDDIRGELGLAIQNSLRFREIEQFTATLEKRIETATRELRASNEKLQQLDAAKDEFISMASHQLRTPLTSVKGYIDMVLDGDAGKITPAQRKLLTEAFESSERMVHLISDFLNVSRLQTGKFMLERRPVDLVRIAQQEVDALKITATAHDLRLSYQKPVALPLLEIDEEKIRQVIMNFIDNAIYYSRPSTTIHVALRQESGDVVFEVIDTGIGVPVVEQKNLFTKFFRATNARKQRPDGTGVGLFLTKRVITAHHGQVIFHSTEGKGSVFGFRLPLAKLRVDDPNNADDHNHD